MFQCLIEPRDVHRTHYQAFVTRCGPEPRVSGHAFHAHNLFSVRDMSTQTSPRTLISLYIDRWQSPGHWSTQCAYKSTSLHACNAMTIAKLKTSSALTQQAQETNVSALRLGLSLAPNESVSIVNAPGELLLLTDDVHGGNQAFRPVSSTTVGGIKYVSLYCFSPVVRHRQLIDSSADLQGRQETYTRQGEGQLVKPLECI